MTTTTAPAPTATSPADRAAAGRQAIIDCPDSFENLQGEGDRDLVQHAASSDERVLAALDAIGDLTAEQTPYLGQYLAEQLVENAIAAEAALQLGAYRAAKSASVPDTGLAYDLTDPKHPGFLDRLGV